MKKLRVGITGCIGSGKSLVAQMLHEFGAVVVDMDKAGRWAIVENEQVRQQLGQTFGDSFFDSHGALQWKKIAAHVFADQSSLQKLNRIVHPVMLQRAMDLITAAEKQSPLMPYLVVDAALIFELHFEENLDRVVTVSAPIETCFQRAQTRLGLSHAEVMQRYNSQLPIEEKQRRADCIIENNGSIDSLRKKAARLHQWLLQQSPAGRVNT